MATQKITKISPQKNAERVNIYLDGEFAFGLKNELFSEYNLGVGQELDRETIKKIQKEDDIKKCLDKAYRYLSYRPRSEKEVRDKLLEKFDETTVQKSISRLKEYHYVDDVAFTNFWIEARGNSRGAMLLQNELFKKGVSKDIVNQALSNLTTDKMVEDALALISSKRKYQNLSSEESYQKIAPFLSRRGYRYDVIKEVLKMLKETV